jgi:hypothetical protein
LGNPGIEQNAARASAHMYLVLAMPARLAKLLREFEQRKPEAIARDGYARVV